MDIKNEIEKVLEKLKKVGKERGDAEKALEYSENYIDQTLSRGGNKKVLAALKLYYQVVLQNTTYPKQEDQPQSLVREPEITYGLKSEEAINDKDKYINALMEEKDRAIKKAESYYEDAKIEKGKMLDIINNTLKEISSNLKEAATSLAHNRQDLALLKDQTYIVSDQLEHQREALNLGFPSEKKTQPVPFVKKGKAGSGAQHDGGKKSKDRS